MKYAVNFQGRLRLITLTLYPGYDILKPFAPPKTSDAVNQIIPAPVG